MLYTLLAILLLVVVVLKFWSPFGQRCPQCQARRKMRNIPCVQIAGGSTKCPAKRTRILRRTTKKTRNSEGHQAALPRPDLRLTIPCTSL